LELDRWIPIYEDIIEDLGYSKDEDEEAAELLAKIRGSDPIKPLEKMRGKTVEIQGPFIEEPTGNIHISAGAAVSRSVDIGSPIDILVTDLDGDTELQIRKNLDGAVVVIHAHGDNIELIERYAERFRGHVISTCQCEPPKIYADNIYNFGGFTDGDRAVYLADHFGAEEIILNGWDLDKPAEKGSDPFIKQKKLSWAERLIQKIETPVVQL